jgi:hypothetical protein
MAESSLWQSFDLLDEVLRPLATDPSRHPVKRRSLAAWGDALDEFLARVMTPAADAQYH